MSVSRTFFAAVLSIPFLSASGWAQMRSFPRGGVWRPGPAQQTDRARTGENEPRGFSPSPAGAAAARREFRPSLQPPESRPALNPGAALNGRLGFGGIFGRPHRGFPPDGIFVSPFFNPFFSPSFNPFLTPFPFNAFLNGFLNPYAPVFGLPSGAFFSQCTILCQPLVTIDFGFSEPAAGEMNGATGISFPDRFSRGKRAPAGDASRAAAARGRILPGGTIFPSRAAPPPDEYSVPAPLANEPMVIQVGYDSQP